MRLVATGTLVVVLGLSGCLTDFSGQAGQRDAAVQQDAAAHQDVAVQQDAAAQQDAAVQQDAVVQQDAELADGGQPPLSRRSCLEHQLGGAVVSGEYEIDPDGPAGPEAPFTVLCDLDTDGGGWTLLANNDNTDQEPSGCIPRLATDDTLACGDVSAGLAADFSLPAWGIPFTELVWAAYDPNGDVVAYRAFRWNSDQELPHAALWTLIPDDNAHAVADYAGLPLITCHFLNANTLTMVWNGNPRNDQAYTTTDILTFFDEDVTTANPGKMTFTEHNGASGSLYGLDDFQDGWGCGDDWSPIGQRGASSFMMVR
ncbi:MAG: fibrinogen-like YCDxxxxGGGW domain-containing protein [bacterium]